MRKAKAVGWLLLLLSLVLAAAQQDASTSIQQALSASSSSGLVQVQLPASSFLANAATSIIVPANTSLLLAGQGNSSTTLQWDLSTGHVTPRITVQAGGVLALTNMALTLSEALPPQLPSSTADAVHWAELFSLPGLDMQAGSTLQLVNVVVILPNCTTLGLYQDTVCAAAQAAVTQVQGAPQAPAAPLYQAPKVRPGWVLFSATSSLVTVGGRQSWRDFSRVALMCAASANMTSVAPGAPGSGDPINPELLQLAARLGPTKCLIRGALTAAQLLGYLVNTSALVQPQGLMVFQLLDNISLAHVSWPKEGVHLTSTVSIVGPPMQPLPSGSAAVTVQPAQIQAAARGVELDLADVPVFLVLDKHNSSILLENLCLVNIALGDDSYFPNSLLVGAVWPIQFDRPSATTTKLLLRNSQLVTPLDLYSYMSHWVGIQSSTVPSVSGTAAWLQNIVYFGLTLGGADNHSLVFSRREGQGTLWINCSLTDLPYHTPVTRSSTGIRELNPNDSLFPITQVQPVRNTSDLIKQVLGPSATPPYLVLLSSMQLTIDAGAKAASAARLNQSIIPITQPLTLIGRPLASMPGPNAAPVALDFGGASCLFSFSLPQGKRVTLQRLVLSGLSAYNATRSALNPDFSETAPSQPLQGNLCSAMWAFDFPRKQQELQLTNTTLVVSPYELAAIQQAVAPSASAALSSLSSAQTVDDATAAALSKAFGVANLAAYAPGSLTFSDLAVAGVSGTDVVLVASDNAPSFSLQAGLGAAGSGSSARLGTGGIVGVVIGSVLLMATLLAIIWVWHHRIQELRNAVDAERAAKTAALNQVEAMVLHGTPPPSDGSHSITMLNSMQASHSSMPASAKLTHTMDIHLDSSGRPPPEGGSSAHAAASAHSKQSGAGLFLQHSSAGGSSGAVHHMVQSLEFEGRGAMLQESASTRRSFQSPSSNSKQQLMQADADGTSSSTAAPPSSQHPAPAADSTQQLPNSGSAYLGAAAAVDSQALTTGTSSDIKSSLEHAGLQVVRGSHDVADLVQLSNALRPGTQLGPSLADTIPSQTSSMDRHSSHDKTAKQLGPGHHAGQLDGDAPAAGTADGTGKEPGSVLAGSGGSGRHRLLEQGLATGGNEQEPALLLQQVIAQRKEMQGIDMQQIQFLNVLGQGNFGVVYKGKWRSLTVAIKTLMFQDASEAKRIRQRAITEAAINSVLTHDNIVNTFAHDLRPVVGGNMPDEPHAACWKLYIIQEYCDGGSLAQAVDKGMLIDTRTKMNNMLLILKIAEDIARGMTYIHENNVIHGDLSSGNVLLRFDATTPLRIQAKVGDFGLSRFLEGPGHSHISNVRQGTPFYIAPEVLKQGVISKPADVFSFGVLLWEMFCGTPPWRDPALTTFQHTLNPLTYPYHVPRTCPAEYHALVMACLAENPKDRPKFENLLQQISQLLSLLQQAICNRYRQAVAS